MSFQAYIENIKAKTGKTPEDFKAAANRKGLLGTGVKTGEIIAWLKKDFGLGYGHAMAVVATLRSDSKPKLTLEERIAKHFAHGKNVWQKPFDRLMTNIRNFGPDVSVSTTDSYISILRNGKKFGIVQTTGNRLDVGIKLKGTKANGRFEDAGSWNAMVTHRVRITDPKDIDREIVQWLRRAYNAA